MLSSLQFSSFTFSAAMKTLPTVPQHLMTWLTINGHQCICVVKVQIGCKSSGRLVCSLLIPGTELCPPYSLV